MHGLQRNRVFGLIGFGLEEKKLNKDGIAGVALATGSLADADDHKRDAERLLARRQDNRLDQRLHNLGPGQLVSCRSLTGRSLLHLGSHLDNV